METGRLNRDALLDRLNAGEWLTTGEVAVVLHTPRTTVDGWLRQDPPRLGFRRHPVSRYRTCNPDDVRALLKAMEEPPADEG